MRNYKCAVCGCPLQKDNHTNRRKYCLSCGLQVHRNQQRTYSRLDRLAKKAAYCQPVEPILEIDCVRPLMWQSLPEEEFEARANQLLAHVARTGRMPRSLESLKILEKNRK